MLLYIPLGYVTESWTAATVAPRVAGCTFPGSSFYAIMGDGIWSVGAAGQIPRAGTIVSGYAGDPELCILQDVGGGEAGGHSWSVWRTISWGSRDLYIPPDQVVALKDRAEFLRAAIRKWEAAHAAHPEAAMRTGIEDWRAELVEIEGRVFSTGGLQLVVYVGYARRWSASSYVLPA